jgi:hypothetical protein
VIGYGFPAEDLYGRILLRETIRRKPDDKPLKIKLFLSRDDAADVGKRLSELFIAERKKMTLQYEWPL